MSFATRVEAGGVSHKLVFSLRSVAEAERLYGGPLLSRFADSANVGMREVLALFEAALVAGSDLDRDEVDAVIDAIGIAGVSQAIGEGLAGFVGAGEGGKGTKAAKATSPT